MPGVCDSSSIVFSIFAHPTTQKCPVLSSFRRAGGFVQGKLAAIPTSRRWCCHSQATRFGTREHGKSKPPFLLLHRSFVQQVISCRAVPCRAISETPTHQRPLNSMQMGSSCVLPSGDFERGGEAMSAMSSSRGGHKGSAWSGCRI